MREKKVFQLLNLNIDLHILEEKSVLKKLHIFLETNALENKVQVSK